MVFRSSMDIGPLHQEAILQTSNRWAYSQNRFLLQLLSWKTLTSGEKNSENIRRITI